MKKPIRRAAIVSLCLLAVGLSLSVGCAGARHPERPADRDNDGVPDAQDKCPDVPEDRDGVEDLDGCPE